MWLTLSSEESTLNSADCFISAVDVFVSRPHILNDRIVGAKVRHIPSSDIEPDILERSSDLYSKIDSIVRHFQSSIRTLPINFKSPEVSTVQDASKKYTPTGYATEVVVYRRVLFPKLTDRYVNFEDIVLIDNQDVISVVFIPLVPRELLQDEKVVHVAPTFIYAIKWKRSEEMITLEVLQSDMSTPDVSSASCRWLQETVFKRIVKWSSQEVPLSAPLPSLSLVPVERYCAYRQALKAKYAKDIVEKWTESTDPLKFVHEDIAIAAYLLTLWECEREELGLDHKQSFVDLGCGNGLLVYILSSEGYKGLGLDLRKRAIWDSFAPAAELVESTLVPSQSSLFPEHDWLIGNHSDELTPWIPMIAARSSHKMRVFLLPCCAFTFDGKYQRTFQGTSQYQSYLNFVEDLCKEAGFTTGRDKLRIPSTKRICFVCSSRSYPASEEAEVEEKRRIYIAKHSRFSSAKNLSSSEGKVEAAEPTSGWAEAFKPREKIEAVRNCTQLDRDFLDETVNTLAQMLLSSGNGSRDIKTSSGIKSYHYGGFFTIGELAEKLDSGTKARLKQQCGGLQTLLRNHKHIFQISEGQVCVTVPPSISEKPQNSSKRFGGKQGSKSSPRSCWFHLHHPQGCPLEDDKCRFQHH